MVKKSVVVHYLDKLGWKEDGDNKDRLMFMDTDRNIGFSINKKLLALILKDVFQSSLVKMEENLQKKVEEEKQNGA